MRIRDATTDDKELGITSTAMYATRANVAQASTAMTTFCKLVLDTIISLDLAKKGETKLILRSSTKEVLMERSTYSSTVSRRTTIIVPRTLFTDLKYEKLQNNADIEFNDYSCGVYRWVV